MIHSSLSSVRFEEYLRSHLDKPARPFCKLVGYLLCILLAQTVHDTTVAPNDQSVCVELKIH
jgi:hypothetical protein